MTSFVIATGRPPRLFRPGTNGAEHAPRNHQDARTDATPRPDATFLLAMERAEDDSARESLPDRDEYLTLRLWSAEDPRAWRDGGAPSPN